MVMAERGDGPAARRPFKAHLKVVYRRASSVSNVASVPDEVTRSE